MPRSDRTVIAKLARGSTGGLINVRAAAGALALSPEAASMKLSSLVRRGWLRRARRGLYLVLPLEVEPGKPTVADDPWVLAHEAFSPCYIGGWSAAEYWGLTEQLFRSTLVITAASVRSRTVQLLGHEFHLFRVPADFISGTALVWRGPERVHVSDQERTIVDCLRYPELCGGVRHLFNIVRAYGQNEKRNFEKLARRAMETKSGAVWKRLGYFAELLWPNEVGLIDEARRHVTAGYIRLDPSVRRRGRLLRRWRLSINVSLSQDETV